MQRAIGLRLAEECVLRGFDRIERRLDVGEVDQRSAAAGKMKANPSVRTKPYSAALARARLVNSSRLGWCASSMPSSTIIWVP
jgi:hypothetical protein